MTSLKINNSIPQKDLRKELEETLQALLKLTPFTVSLQFASEGFISKYFSLMEKTAQSQLLNINMREDEALAEQALAIQKSLSVLPQAFPRLITSDTLTTGEQSNYSPLLERASYGFAAGNPAFKNANYESGPKPGEPESIQMNSKEDIREISQRLALLNSQSLLGRGIK